MIYKLKNEGFWLDETAKALLQYLNEQNVPEDAVISCAAGMTPSCPIHFGIFREIAISAFVAEELRRRGRRVKLVYYWDDFDHFCKVPWYAAKKQVQEHMGKPLREVPDFDGNYNSYGEHYMRSFEQCLHKAGFFPNYNYQSELYSTGYYNPYIRIALEKRREIYDIIQDVKSTAMEDPATMKANPSEREAFYPVEVYCRRCRRDTTVINSYDKEKEELSYHCKKCGHKDSYRLDSSFQGKLIWKVNWAARWADDLVCYESSGENQLTDTGSYSVSSRIAREIFNAQVPFSLLYHFIGAPGVAKVSRKMGKAALAETMSRVLEAPVIRWLMLRTSPARPFTLDLGQGIFRIYHEWDKFAQAVREGEAPEQDKRLYDISVRGVQYSRVPVPFRTLTTALGLAGGDRVMACRLLMRIMDFKGTNEELYKHIKTRMDAAHAWLYDCGYIKYEQSLRKTFNKKAWAALSENCQRGIDLIYKEAGKFKSENKLAEFLYTIPKTLLGLPLDNPINDEIKTLQKEIFTGAYRLLLGEAKGPKLSTLLFLLEPVKLQTLLRGIRK